MIIGNKNWWKTQWSQNAAETTVSSWQSSPRQNETHIWSVAVESLETYCNSENKFLRWRGQKADGSKMTVFVFSLKRSRTQEPLRANKGGKKTGNVWIKSSNCISSMALFTRTNRATSPYWVKQWKKCHSVFFPPKSREPMPTSAGSQGLLKQGLKCPNNNYAVRGV